MRLRLPILVIFLCSCSQEQFSEPSFNQKYETLCGAMNDIALYALEIHVSKSPADFDQIRKESSKIFAEKSGFKGELPSTTNCEDIEAVAAQHSDKTKITMYSSALAYFMQGLDPHSIYIPQSRVEEVIKQDKNIYFEAGFETKYVHRAIKLALPTDRLLVDYVYPGTPAFEKLQPEDEIEQINDVDVKEMSFFDLYNTIREETERIKVKVDRVDDPFVFSKIQIKKPAVYSKGIKETNYDYRWIRINKFNEGSSKQFETELIRANEWGSKGIIVDLRGNPGGLVDEGAKVLKMLITRPGAMFHTQGFAKQNGYKNQTYKTNGNALYKKPVVVLVDSETASTAEIVTAVLQSQSRALIVGDETFGKATVQITTPVPTINGFGGMMFTTVSMLYSSNETSHQMRGVHPDYSIQDPRISGALEVLKTWKDPFIEHESEYKNAIHPLNEDKIIPQNNLLSYIQAVGSNEVRDLSGICDDEIYQNCLLTHATRFLEIMVNRH